MHRLFHLLIMISLAMLGCSQDRQKVAPQDSTGSQKPPTGESRRIPLFDGPRAFAYLTAQTSFGPRNPNSVGHQECLEYLTTVLRSFAEQQRVQEFSHVGYGGERLALTNIIASFRPELHERVLLCAHWDTRPRAENDENKSRRNEPIIGANDGASGVAVLLEMARNLKQVPPPIGVDLVLLDGEDYGKEGDQARYLLGSRFFAQNKPADYVPRFGVLLDMVGDKFLEIPKEQHSLRFAPDIVDLIWNTARDLGYPQFVHETGEEVLDDHVPLNEAGIKTVDLIDFNYPDQTNRYWHSLQDIPDHCSAESLAAVGTVLTHVVYLQKP